MSSPLFKPLAGLFLLCFSLAPWRLAAQESPKLLIASIVVEGVSQGAARRIAAAETLLQTGRTYSEQEVRLGVYRVRRLPFVVNAEYTLHKRSEGEGYDLVIQVIEQSPLFFSFSANGLRSQQENFSSGRKHTDTTWQQFGFLGGRAFVGSSGVAEAIVEKIQHQDGEIVQGGYTQYDLFGAGTLVGGVYDSTHGAKGYDQEQASLFGVLPLTAAQSLRLSLAWGRFRQSGFSEVLSMSRGVDLSWSYNTLDDPSFPLRGSSGSAGWSYRRDTDHDSFVFRDEDGQDVRFDNRSTSYTRGVSLGLSHYFPVTDRQALSLVGNVNRSKSVNDGFRNGPWQWTLSVGHAIGLLGFDKDHRFGDLYWENAVMANYFYYDATTGRGSASSRDGSFVSSLGYRSRWGVVRATFTYGGLWRSN